jgi:type I restriction enzyme, S subunit
MKNETGFPATWSIASVGELCTSLQYGYTASATAQKCGPRLLRITDIQNGAVAWSTVPYCVIEDDRIEKYSLQSGDIVFARTGGTVGKSYIIAKVPETTIFASYLIRLTSHAAVFPKFLYHFFQSTSYWEQIGLKKGGLQGNVNATTLSTLRIPLCTLNEQQRIVAKIEELFSELDKGIEALTTAHEQLKAYRGSVLKHAFETNSDDWPEYTIGQLLADIRYGTAKKCAVDRQKTPVLRIPNIVSGRINLDDLKHTDFRDDELEKLRLQFGDILLVRSNGSVSLVGLSAVVTANAVGHAYAGYLIRLRLKKEIILPDFLNLYLQTPRVRIDIERQARSSSGVHNIVSIRRGPQCRLSAERSGIGPTRGGGYRRIRAF